LLPHHPEILAATIDVSIIGPNNLPAQCLPSLLNVNHLRIQATLQFLQKNNHLYHDIVISKVNGVPN
ncbi:hypothetical protein F4604DRAFT_1575599, partial [Suillus subluteus]